MGDRKISSKKLPITLGVVCIILAIVIVLMFFNFIPIWGSNKEAKLVNVGLGARDLGRDAQFTERALRIEGYVCNVGIETAYKARLHVVADYVTGGNAIDTYVNIGLGGVIYGEDSSEVEVDIPYSAYADLGSWTLTPIWSATP